MIAAIINYCSLDERFIRKCIQNALLVADEVIVPVSDHLFDGRPENIQSIEQLALEFPTVNLQLYNWHPGLEPRYWHNMSRIVGTSLLSVNCEWVMFLDSDEIVEADLLKHYIGSSQLNNYDSYKLSCYWYFREPIYQALTTETSPVLVRRELISINPYDQYCEREQLFEYLNIRKYHGLTVDGQPLVHHYSWVRTKEQMLQKVSTWGHAHDKDWKSLIEEEFSRPFNGSDFVHGYKYKIVDNKYSL